MNAHEGVFRQLAALAACAPRELWTVYALKFLESVAYFSSSINLTLYLTLALGFDDATAGFLYSVWGVVTGVCSVLCGPYVDRFGVQRSVAFGGVLVTLGRLFFVVAPGNKPLALAGLLVFQPIGMGLAIPVLTICIRRIFSEPSGDPGSHASIAHMRPLAYGVFYSVMNVAALTGGVVTDALMNAFSAPSAGQGEGAGANGQGEALRKVFAVGTALSAVYCLVAACFPLVPAPERVAPGKDGPRNAPWLREMIAAREARTKKRTEKVAKWNASFGGPWPGLRSFLWARLGPLHGGATPLREGVVAGETESEEEREEEEEDDDLERFGAPYSPGNEPFAAPEKTNDRLAWSSMLRDPTLWKLSALSAILFGSRSVFRHVDATLPKYLRRTVSATARYGLVYAINPALIIACVPPVQAFIASRRLDLYWCIFFGSLAATLAPFAFVLCEGAARWHGYAGAVGFMLLLTAGEAVSSPLSYEFFMRLAPPGREGVYGSLASAPIFFVKLFVGTMSGNLLQDFCPAAALPGPLSPLRDTCWHVWVFVGAMAAPTPALLLLLRSWLYSGEIKRKVQGNA